MNGHQGFTEAIADTELEMQFVVTDMPDGGDLHYHVSIGGGTVRMAPGELPAPDATITNSYRTAAKIAQRELNPTMAFMTGKLKASGNLAKLMANQGALNQIQDAMDAVDVEY